MLSMVQMGLSRAGGYGRWGYCSNSVVSYDNNEHATVLFRTLWTTFLLPTRTW